MNYANMIEEKNLKKTFIIATLCSTLIGTFTSSIGLWDRVADKRKQKKLDSHQDDKIKQLTEKVEAAEKRSKERVDELQRRDRGGDDVGRNFETSGALIQRQFDEGYGRLGKRFAQGDTITENALQAQVIQLQQTVINVLQDALYNDRQLTRADMAKLISASNSAREGSISALQQQQRRLAIEGSQSGGSQIGSPPLRALTAPSSRSSSVISSAPLFCRYALELQFIPNKPLAASFAPGGDCRCPCCNTRIAATSDDFWSIGKRTPLLIADGPYEKHILETREFTLGQRFVLKCHTSSGEYACIICNRHREVDAICRTVEGLVNHVGRFHEVAELEKEEGLRESKRPLMLTGPPPPAPEVPRPTVREVKEVHVEYH
ncbi:hypothetical protein P154DRAFT_553651 [Amniculicola lignicola CBS 123094]|uniref:Uncharacterized protein n=1 Tax=Amniculicola lignicola CBS 123094 TaxID=1392246 RepID=A0A6A5WI40_9PLEO|nr:hypothetical protein P154DRAFT_553651 [Amniculicola lignicola CBS 123094]